jgi:hypothetical protein
MWDAITSGVMSGFGKLLSAYVIVVLVLVARIFAEKTSSKRFIAFSVIGSAILAILVAEGRGRGIDPSCESDPLFGSCTSVQEYFPTTKQYIEDLVGTFSTTCTSALLGWYWARNKNFLGL